MTAIAPSWPIDCQLVRIDVSRMSAASWNVSPAINQRP
jgi:hypothetical protein